MPSIIDQMTHIYVFVDDFLKTHSKLSLWRSSNNSEPQFTDAEVITIALMQPALGVANLKNAYSIVADNFLSAFPNLCSYKQWVARLHALDEIIGHLVEAARNTDGFETNLFIFDSKPIPVCKPIRHSRVRLMREDGAWFGKSSKGWFFGFKLHASININGHCVGGVLLPGNLDDRQAAVALGLMSDGGVALGDMGYSGEEIADQLAEEAEMLLIRKADVEDKKALICSLRARVETFFSQLWAIFIDRVYSRSWRGLWNTIKVKLFFYNLRHAGILSI